MPADTTWKSRQVISKVFYSATVLGEEALGEEMRQLYTPTIERKWPTVYKYSVIQSAIQLKPTVAHCVQFYIPIDYVYTMLMRRRGCQWWR